MSSESAGAPLYFEREIFQTSLCAVSEHVRRIDVPFKVPERISRFIDEVTRIRGVDLSVEVGAQGKCNVTVSPCSGPINHAALNIIESKESCFSLIALSAISNYREGEKGPAKMQLNLLRPLLLHLFITPRAEKR